MSPSSTIANNGAKWNISYITVNTTGCRRVAPPLEFDNRFSEHLKVANVRIDTDNRFPEDLEVPDVSVAGYYNFAEDLRVANIGSHLGLYLDASLRCRRCRHGPCCARVRIYDINFIVEPRRPDVRHKCARC